MKIFSSEVIIISLVYTKTVDSIDFVCAQIAIHSHLWLGKCPPLGTSTLGE